MKRIYNAMAALAVGAAVLSSACLSARADDQPWYQFKTDPKQRLWGFPEAKPKKQIKISATIPDLNSSYFIAVAYGLEDEAKRAGVKLDRLLSAGGYDKLPNQVSQVEDLIASDSDVILLWAVSSEGTADVVNRAVAAGKIVITYVSGTTSDKVYASLLEDYTGAGERQALYHCDHLGKTNGNEIAMLNGPAGAQWAMQMHDGFVKTIHDKCPNVKIVDEKWLPISASDELKAADDWFQRYPDLNGIYSVYADVARGAMSAILAAKKPANFVLTTQGLSPWAKTEMEAGHINMTAVSAPVAMGRWAIQSAIHAVNGDPAPGNAKPLLTPTPAATKDTLPNVDYSIMFYPDDFKPAQ